MIVDDLIERVMQKAGAAHAVGAQACMQQSEATGVSFENDKLKSAISSQKTEINLKVILDGKIGVSTTTDLHDLDGVVERALAAAQFGSPAHFQFSGFQPKPAVKVCDDRIASIPKIEMVQTGQGMLERVKAYNPEILVSCGSQKHVQKTEYANSAGGRLADESTDYKAGVFGQWIRGQDMLFAWHNLGSRKYDIDPEALTDRTIEWFRLAERTASVQSRNMPVIFTPHGLIVLLLSIQMGLDSKNVLLGESPLADKLEKQVADPRFTLVDDPLIDWAPGSSTFDDEGLPRRVTPLIESGVVQQFVYDLDTAGRAGKQPTGHGSGRWPTNWAISPGDTPYEDMIRSTRQGLLVHSVMGLGQGNPISGEFSVNVSLGYKIENGEIAGRVKDVMLAGNVYDALKDIAAIGDQPEWVSGDMAWITMFAPPIQIGKLSVVGK